MGAITAIAAAACGLSVENIFTISVATLDPADADELC